MRSIREIVEEVYKAGVEGGASSVVEPAIKELEKYEEYAALLEQGMSAYEARGTVWGQEN
jgi:hypothetical protein